MIHCGYTAHGRDRAYYNFNENEMHRISSMGIKIASGYKTALDVFNGERILLCSELCHKLMNFQNCWETMTRNEYYNRDKSRWREFCIKEFVGQTVMTEYNHTPYRVDDINFDVKPESTFKKSDGQDISFIDYYEKRYQRRVKDLNQIMFVCMPKIKRQQKGSQITCEPPRSILLLPEFCVRTGDFFFLLLNNLIIKS